MLPRTAERSMSPSTLVVRRQTARPRVRPLGNIRPRCEVSSVAVAESHHGGMGTHVVPRRRLARSEPAIFSALTHRNSFCASYQPVDTLALSRSLCATRPRPRWCAHVPNGATRKCRLLLDAPQSSRSPPAPVAEAQSTDARSAYSWPQLGLQRTTTQTTCSVSGSGIGFVFCPGSAYPCTRPVLVTLTIPRQVSDCSQL